MVYIHSTCGQPQTFKIYKDRPSKSAETVNQPALDKKGKPIEIALGGGAYVLDVNGNAVRKVVITEVTDEELELLHKCDTYIRMKERGFFTEHQTGHIVPDSKGNPDNMEIKDGTSQISDHDHAQGTDERCNHGETRATGGPANQMGGEQPIGATTNDYGPIRLG